MESKTQPVLNINAAALPSAGAKPVSARPTGPRSHTLPLLILSLLIAMITGSFYSNSPLKNANVGFVPPRPIATPSPTPIATPTPTIIVVKKTSETYTNQRLNFSLKYPTQLRYREYTRDFAYISSSDDISFSPTKVTNNRSPLITIEIEDNKDNLTIDQYMSTYLFCDQASAAKNNCEVIEHGTHLLIGGEEAKVADVPGLAPFREAVVPHNGKIFSFRLTYDASFKQVYSKNEAESVFNQMLSSFIFLDQIEPTPADSGIKGKVLISPLCPSSDLPTPTPGGPDPCVKPYEATILVKSEDGSREIASLSSDSAGNIQANLPVGTYLLQPLPPLNPPTQGAPIPSAGAQKVYVQAHNMTLIQINYDSGVRF